MIKKYKTSIILFALAALCILVVWIIDNPTSNIFALLVFIPLFVLGCRFIAVAKGYNGSVGLLLGLTMIIGLIILIILPDRILKEMPKV